jgi:hypothetical protein
MTGPELFWTSLHNNISCLLPGGLSVQRENLLPIMLGLPSKFYRIFALMSMLLCLEIGYTRLLG